MSHSLSRIAPRAQLYSTWRWGWVAAAHLIGDLFLGCLYLILPVLLLVGLVTLPVFGIGLIFLAPTLPLTVLAGSFERLRVQALLGVELPRPRPWPDRAAGWRGWLLDARPWRAAGYLTVITCWGFVVGSVVLVLLSIGLALAALPLYVAALPTGHLTMPLGPDLPATWWPWLIGVALLGVVPLLARGLAGVDLALARWLLGPARTEQVTRLTERVETLHRTREAAVDSVEQERRRIERDLHDGPQQRLVSIAMDLGMARSKLGDDPAGAEELLGKAHAAAKEAIVDMRQVARGIHPPILTDRGLDAALSALAARCPVPVTVSVQTPRRPSPTIEAIAYFCVSEALTNIAKHAAATQARVEVVGRDGRLEVRVTDDGRGGADPAHGTGLSGLRQRLATVDGTLDLTSPSGKGTRVTVLLPMPPEPAPPPTTEATEPTTDPTTEPTPGSTP